MALARYCSLAMMAQAYVNTMGRASSEYRASADRFVFVVV
jgi:hypothetical protein